MDELTVLSHPARVRAVPDNTAALTTILQERFAVPSEQPLYFWRAEISNGLLDSHFTHMAESTLRNYASDAKEGVAFLKGHNWQALPIGYSLDAAYEIEGDKKRVVADFYTVAGLAETDDLIARMKSGILRDVSVGFHGGTMQCDLCQRGFWECPHIPGLKYEVKDGDTVRSKLATFTIEDARLSEVSGVFDGSTPGAMILKAQERANELTDTQRHLLEQRYRVKLPATQRAFAGADMKVGQKPGEDNNMGMQEDFNKVRSLVAVETDDEVVPAVETLKRRVGELEPQAADGRQYRSDLVAEALAEGVRAQGKDFDSATYETVLTNAPIVTIKRMRDDWKRLGDERLAGGRKSVDDAQDSKESKQETKPVSFVPDAAYRG